jgi:hypothetical protein
MTDSAHVVARSLPPDDADLVPASLTRPESFTEIFERYYAEIHRYVYRRLGADAADDIAAETFLVAFSAACPVRCRTRLGTAVAVRHRHPAGEQASPKRGTAVPRACSDRHRSGRRKS